jgi:hypothetical protein
LELKIIFLGQPRGFAYITFHEDDPVDPAIHAKPHTINDQQEDEV